MVPISVFDADGEQIKYLDCSAVRVSPNVRNGRIEYTIFTPWKSLFSEPLRLMEKIAIPNVNSGELIIGRIIQLSEQGWGGNAFIIISIKKTTVRVNLKKVFATV